MSERKKTLWPWIVALLIGLPVLYVASVGPAFWLVARRHLNHKTVEAAYWPVLLWADGQAFWRLHALQWYAGIWMPEGTHFLLDFTDPDTFEYSIPFNSR